MKDDANAEITRAAKMRDVLGHPFHTVAWLAGHLAKAGGGLCAGDCRRVLSMTHA